MFSELSSRIKLAVVVVGAIKVIFISFVRGVCANRNDWFKFRETILNEAFTKCYDRNGAQKDWARQKTQERKFTVFLRMRRQSHALMDEIRPNFWVRLPFHLLWVLLVGQTHKFTGAYSFTMATYGHHSLMYGAHETPWARVRGSTER